MSRILNPPENAWRAAALYVPWRTNFHNAEGLRSIRGRVISLLEC
jgi:hypothetical protein